VELSDIIIDPDFQKLIPPLTDEERKDLEASLVADGCISPLVVWHKHNILLDGHNRHRFCEEHDIECEIHEIMLPSREDATAWIIKHQLGRRNLNESQRAMLAATLKEVFVVGASKRKSDGQKMGALVRHGKAAAPVPVAPAAKGREDDSCFRSDLTGSRNPNKNEENDSNEGDSCLVSDLTGSKKNSGKKARDEAAAAMNVSSTLVHAAEKIKTAGSEKLQQSVLAGEASVTAAATIAKLPKAKQDQLVDSGPRAIREAARDMQKSRSSKPPVPTSPLGTATADGTAGTGRPKKFTEKQFAELAAQVTELKRLTDVPSMELSRIHIRRVVAEIVKLVL